LQKEGLQKTRLTAAFGWRSASSAAVITVALNSALAAEVHTSCAITNFPMDICTLLIYKYFTAKSLFLKDLAELTR
jgi:hypothetical protein